jgi:F0F1-type ATP synthase membrane subunit c/vacuolar-type H+-ATPase subunit K
LLADLLIACGIVIATGLSTVGAIFGIITAGVAMAGAGTQRPEVLTKALIAVVLAEAIAIYGLLASFLLVAKIGTVTTDAGGIDALAAGTVIGIAGLAAGIGIGYSGASMASAAAEKPETFSKNVVAVVLAEAIAIYGLLIAFMMISKI